MVGDYALQSEVCEVLVCGDDEVVAHGGALVHGGVLVDEVGHGVVLVDEVVHGVVWVGDVVVKDLCLCMVGCVLGEKENDDKNEEEEMDEKEQDCDLGLVDHGVWQFLVHDVEFHGEMDEVNESVYCALVKVVHDVALHGQV